MTAVRPEGRPARATPLGDIFRLFLLLGTTAFGGPAAHIAMMEEQVVRRRRWLTRAEFLDYVAAAHVMPGPNSTELALHIGHARGGWPGLLVAGLSFILPASAIVGAIAWLYVRFGTMPLTERLLYGVKPVVIAIVAQALWVLGRSALRRPSLAAVFAAALVASAAGLHELLVLAGGGVLAAILTIRGGPRPRSAIALAAATACTSAAAGAALAPAAAAGGAGLWPMFLVFLKAGALLFGSGYVLLAFIRADLVERLGWLTEQQLLDAIAVGQVTPGPLFTTATFIGYVLGGASGAAVATVAIFLPAFIFVAVSGPLVPRVRRSAAASSVLDGVIAGSLALMAMVCWQLARAALTDVFTIVLAALSLAVLIRFRINSAWLVAAGAAAGAAASLIAG